MFFHFNTTRKYTASILNLFNDIEIETKLSDNRLKYTKIPIQYSNRERFEVFSQLSYDQIFLGNSQVLPRAILRFEGLQPLQERTRNKFFKIYNQKLMTKDGPKILKYQFNSIPYNFIYQVIMQCRGMNEASMIIEQVCSYFNPTYCMRIQEIDLPDFGYTSIILDLNNTSVEQQSLEEDLSTNIVTITFDLTLRGNLYPAIKEQETIELVQLFLSSPVQGRVERARSLSYNAEERFRNMYKAVIEDITYDREILHCKIKAECEKYIKFTYDWYINDVLQDYHKNNMSYSLRNGDVVRVRAYTDLVETNIFEKRIFTDSYFEDLIINDIKYDGNYLEVNFTDSSKTPVKYDFIWFINGELRPQTQRIIKYSDEKTFDVRCIIEVSDGRKIEKYKKFWANGIQLDSEMSGVTDNLASLEATEFKDKFSIGDTFKTETYRWTQNYPETKFNKDNPFDPNLKPVLTDSENLT